MPDRRGRTTDARFVKVSKQKCSHVLNKRYEPLCSVIERCRTTVSEMKARVNIPRV